MVVNCKLGFVNCKVRRLSYSDYKKYYNLVIGNTVLVYIILPGLLVYYNLNNV